MLLYRTLLEEDCQDQQSLGFRRFCVAQQPRARSPSRPLAPMWSNMGRRRCVRRGGVSSIRANAMPVVGAANFGNQEANPTNQGNPEIKRYRRNQAIK